MTTIADRIGELAENLQTAEELRTQALHDLAAELDKWAAQQQAFVKQLLEQVV